MMKASCCFSARVTALFVLLTASMLLTQCSMPSQQAWRYIRTHGLLTYWQYENQQSSPPFRTGVSRSTPRYVANNRSSVNAPRYGYRPSSIWSSFWGYDRTPSYYAQNRYYIAPQPSRSESRPSPRPRPSSPSPSTRKQEDAPSSPAPQIATNEPSAPSSPPPPKPSAPTTDLPYGTPVAGRVNMVNSPYAGKTQLVDVSGMGPGQTVKCPYTGKLFKVPSSQQAENKVEPRQEAKDETQSSSSEPKSGDKKPE